MYDAPEENAVSTWSAEERVLRIELAAAYRLVDHLM